MPKETDVEFFMRCAADFERNALYYRQRGMKVEAQKFFNGAKSCLNQAIEAERREKINVV